MKLKPSHVLLTASLLLAGACSGGEQGDDEKTINADAGQTGGVPESFWSDTPIEGWKDIKEVRDAQTLPIGEVVLRGTLQEFGELASFKLVEDSLEDCSESGDDVCPTPWDYCCTDATELARYTVNVELTEDGDLPGPWKLEGYHGLEKLSEVVVRGKLIEDEAGNLRVAANKIAMQ